MALMEVVKHKNPVDIPDSHKIIVDHFAEHVRDGMLRRELKRLIRQQPFITFIDFRSEAICWADDGERFSALRARAYSCDTHSDAVDLEVKTSAVVVEPNKEINELKEMLHKQQAQF